MKKILFAVFVFVIGFQSGYYVNKNKQEPTPQATQPQPSVRSAFQKDNILILINEKRLQAGLEMFSENTDLDVFAQEISDDISLSQKCSHDFLRDKRLVREQKANVAEVLACNYSGSDTAVEGLMNSPTHKAIILDKTLKNIGIGISGSIIVVHFL